MNLTFKHKQFMLFNANQRYKGFTMNILGIITLGFLAFGTVTTTNAIEATAGSPNTVINATNNMQVDAYKKFTEAFIENIEVCARKNMFYSPNSPSADWNNATEKCVSKSQTCAKESQHYNGTKCVSREQICAEKDKYYSPESEAKYRDGNDCVSRAQVCALKGKLYSPSSPDKYQDSDECVSREQICAAKKKLYAPTAAASLQDVDDCIVASTPSLRNSPGEQFVRVTGDAPDGKRKTYTEKSEKVHDLCVLSQVRINGETMQLRDCAVTGAPGQKWEIEMTVAGGDLTCMMRCYDFE